MRVAGAQRSEPHRDLRKLLVGVGALYLVSSAALSAIGRPAAVPWGFTLPVPDVCRPAPGARDRGWSRSPARVAGLPEGRSPVAICVCRSRCGSDVCGTFSCPLDSRRLAFGITTVQHWSRQKLTTAGLACLTVALGYACVWNGNYLLAATVEGRLHDATFIAIDSMVWGRQYQQVFPLWTNHFVFVLLENSYVMLFPQVIVVVLVIAATQPREVVCRYLMVLFSAYTIGLAIFAVFPAVGPPIYVPASFKADWSGTFTAQLMKDMAAEFQQVQKGGGLNGFGYFVAFPSLHVAAAVILQRCMRNTPWLYWTWMPVTFLLILSTVVLGYHYLLDVPAGCILGYVLCRFLPRGVPVEATELLAGRGGEVVD